MQANEKYLICHIFTVQWVMNEIFGDLPRFQVEMILFRVKAVVPAWQNKAALKTSFFSPTILILFFILMGAF